MKTKIHRIINVGLGYLSLDRQTMTLSGGEAQRIKLAATLDSSITGIIYIIDEPTIGLHPMDVENFLVLLNVMVDSGSTVIVVEHNVQVIEASDWIIDLGPEGGINGGRVIGVGTPDDIRSNENSVTGKYI